MDCNETRSRLDAPGSAGDALEAIEAHLETCSDCTRYSETLGLSSTWLALLRNEEAPQLSSGFWVRFWERHAAGVPDFWAILTVLARRTSIALGIALVALVLGLQFFVEPTEPAMAGLDRPTDYWAAPAVQAEDAEAARDQAVLTLVARTE